MVVRPCLCRYAWLVQQAHRRRDFYRLDFLWPRCCGHLSNPARLRRQAHSLPRSRLPLDAPRLRPRCVSHCWQRYFSSLPRPGPIPQSHRRNRHHAPRSPRLFLLAQTSSFLKLWRTTYRPLAVDYRSTARNRTRIADRTTTKALHERPEASRLLLGLSEEVTLIGTIHRKPAHYLFLACGEHR